MCSLHSLSDAQTARGSQAFSSASRSCGITNGNYSIRYLEFPHSYRSRKHLCTSDNWLLHKVDWSVSFEWSASSNCCWHLRYSSFLAVWSSKNNPLGSSAWVHVRSDTWTLLPAGNKTDKNMLIPSPVRRIGWAIQLHLDWYVGEVLRRKNGRLGQALAISHECLSRHDERKHFMLSKFANAWTGNYTSNRPHVSANWLSSLPVSGWICWMDSTNHAGQLWVGQEEP